MHDFVRQKVNMPNNVNGAEEFCKNSTDFHVADRKRIKLDEYSNSRRCVQKSNEKLEVLTEIGFLEEEFCDENINTSSRRKQQVITNYFHIEQHKDQKPITPIEKYPRNLDNLVHSTDLEKENNHDFLNCTNPLMIVSNHFGLCKGVENEVLKSSKSPCCSAKRRNRIIHETEQDNKSDNSEISEITMQSSSSATGRSPLSDLYNITINRNLHSKEIQHIQDFYIYRKRDTTKQISDIFFNLLSDEMVLSIFKWLPKKTLMRCSLVCKRWYRISQDESLWTRLDLGGKILPDDCIIKILSRGTLILRMAQTEIAEVAFPVQCLSAGVSFQSKVQYLDLSMAVLDAKTLIDILSRCKSLKKLSLEHVKVNDDICKQISENRGLEVLNLCMSQGITLKGTKYLMDGCKLLHALNISWTCLSYEAIQYLCDNLQQCLTRLNIAGNRKTLTDKMIEVLIKNCNCLIDLDLSDCTLLTETSVYKLIELTTLEHLCLSRCYNIKPTAYTIMHRYSSLMYLDIFGLMSEQAITMLASQLPQVGINKFLHSSIARPTVGTRRTSIWGLRTRD